MQKSKSGQMKHTLKDLFSSTDYKDKDLVEV